MNKHMIEQAFLVLINAINAFEVGASIADEDIPLWNTILNAKNAMKEQIEAQP